MGELCQLRLTARAVSDEIRRARAVIGMRAMRMTLFLTLMPVAVEIMAASILAVELSCPALGDRIRAVSSMGVEALMLFPSILAENVLLGLSTVASGWHAHFASAAQTFVA